MDATRPGLPKYSYLGCSTCNRSRRARLAQILDLLAEDSRLNVHAGELEVRPAFALRTREGCPPTCPPKVEARSAKVDLREVRPASHQVRAPLGRTEEPGRWTNIPSPRAGLSQGRAARRGTPVPGWPSECHWIVGASGLRPRGPTHVGAPSAARCTRRGAQASTTRARRWRPTARRRSRTSGRRTA